jgi:hypothetical protein
MDVRIKSTKFHRLPTQKSLEIQPDGWNNATFASQSIRSGSHSGNATSRLRSNTVTSNNGNGGNGGNIGGNDKKRPLSEIQTATATANNIRNNHKSFGQLDKTALP